MPKKSESQIRSELVRGLRVSKRRTKQPVIVAMIGITGVGNSTIARELSRRLGWSVIETNRIRVKLREEGPGFNPARVDRIAAAMTAKALAARANVILDSDFVIKSKRRRLERRAKRFGARVVYLHLLCGPDVMIARMLRAAYNPKTDIFRTAAIAVREHLRRFPWHYRWSPAGGGRWTPLRPPVKPVATINTADPEQWNKRLIVLSRRLRRL